MKTAKRIHEMPRAGIRVIFDMARNMTDVIHLEIGSPDLATPPAVCEAGINAIRGGRTRYTPNAGMDELRRKAASYVSRRKGMDIRPENIVITTGGMGALASTFAAILDPGDEVLVPDPGWPNYTMQVTCSGGTAVSYDLHAEHGFRPRSEDIAARVTAGAKAVVTNSPSNPTGAVMDEKTVEDVLEIARANDLAIVSDEVYEDIVYDLPNASFVRAGALDNVACIYSFSKTWAMTGWRIGYVVTSEELAAEIAKLQEVYYACASSISQAAAAAALDMDEGEVARTLETYRRRRDMVARMLAEKGIAFFKPEGAFYCLVDISSSGMDSETFAVELLKAERVAVAPGNTFGVNAENMVRICFAVEDGQLQEGIERFSAFLGKTSA